MQYDLLIINGKILPQAATASRCLINSGFVGIKAGAITAIGPMTAAPEAQDAVQVMDAAGKLVMPGLVNSHGHSAMTLLRGLADDLPLMSWLQDHIFPAEARLVNPDMVYWCSKLAAAEMIMAGTTTVADAYFYQDAAVQAFIDSGLRAVSAQGVIDFPAPGVPDPKKNVEAAAAFIDRWQGKNSRITPAVFCHSPYTCSPETLQRAKAMAQDRGTLFFLHLAETNDEVRQIQENYGVTPIRHLQRLGLLDPATICVHTVWLEPEEILILAAHGAGVSHCPESNMKLASGIAPIPAMIDAGITVGLGTDGCASNNDLDLFREMDTCAKLHKVKHLDATILPARQVLHLATLGSARLLGLDSQIGSLAPGKRADLILLELNQPHLTPFYNEDLLVYAATGSDVTTVIIDGNIVMEERKIRSFDLAETMTKVRELSQSLEGVGRI